MNTIYIYIEIETDSPLGRRITKTGLPYNPEFLEWTHPKQIRSLRQTFRKIRSSKKDKLIAFHYPETQLRRIQLQ